MSYLKIWSGAPDEKYKPLADSVHFAFSEDGTVWEKLNLGYGLLFAEGVILKDNTIEERSLCNPSFVKVDEGYGIVAETMNLADEKTNPNQLILWKTKDFIDFCECGLVAKTEIPEYENRLVQLLEIPETLVERIKRRWLPIQSVSVSVPEEIVISDLEELKQIKAEVKYNDGSIDMKHICWNLENLEGKEEGTFEIEGEVQEKSFEFPLTTGHGDPVLFKWEGSWYYIATSDNTDDVGFFVRKADTVEELFAPGIEEHLILDYDEEKDRVQTFWAPEFHVIGGELYLLFALGGKVWAPQSYVMKLKKGGEIINPADWEEPVRVRKMDGTFLAEDAITLDMTFFRGKRASYYAWSWRKHIGTPLDSGSMIYVATVDEANPYQLTSEPVLLTRPVYNWENRGRTINNEGPYPLVLGDTLYLMYSGGSANGESYAVGYMKADLNDDLLKEESWTQSLTPVMFSEFVPDIYGPGHNSVYWDEDGKVWNAYHAKQSDTDELRCAAINRIHIDKEGNPVFSMSTEQDLSNKLKKVTSKVTIKK